MKQIIRQRDLCQCWNCETIPDMWQRDNGSFQIKCPKCGTKTRWTKKAEAIIDWFNFLLQGNSYYKKYNGKSQNRKDLAHEYD